MDLFTANIEATKEAAKKSSLCERCCAYRRERCGAITNYGPGICPRIYEERQRDKSRGEVMKPDERKFLTELQRRAKLENFPKVRQIISELGMNEKRASYILLKWTGKGWFNYGTHEFTGWLTEEGKTK